MKISRTSGETPQNAPAPQPNGPLGADPRANDDP